MHELLNVLYVQTQGAVLHLERDTVRVSVEHETVLRAPLLRLGGIVVFGQVTITPFLIQRCAEDGRSLVWLTRNGRFKGRLEGAARGNVLLRRAQHLALSDTERTWRIARQIVAAKVQNSRQVLLRAAREAADNAAALALDDAAGALAQILLRLRDIDNLEQTRGAEGEAARAYFSVFGHMLRPAHPEARPEPGRRGSKGHPEACPEPGRREPGRREPGRRACPEPGRREPDRRACPEPGRREPGRREPGRREPGGRGSEDAFAFDGRSRRPPRDRANALLSFLYALVRGECASALEGVGLDPQVGYLHALRPGRPALALDLMEELRPVMADRLAITLINRRQLRPEHFEESPGGAVGLTEEGRKAVIIAYQKRKEAEIQHRVLKQAVPLGLVPHVQARLLARHLRRDLKDYPPFLYR
jgi:CRISPR-associated protein Cas1